MTRASNLRLVEAGPLKLSAFILAIRDEFVLRADLSEQQALASAVAAIEWWEDCEETVQLTRACAKEIVGSELEHWDAD